MRSGNRSLLFAVTAVLVTASAWGANAQMDESDEPEPAAPQEAAVEFPAYPTAESLLPFDAGSASGNRFLIDQKSISVGADGVVRYVLVVRSPSGVENVSFEGLRCETVQRRLYATGRSDRTWSRSRNDNWMEISSSTVSLPHNALARLYLCDHGLPIRSAKEGVDALRRGGPPGWLGS